MRKDLFGPKLEQLSLLLIGYLVNLVGLIHGLNWIDLAKLKYFNNLDFAEMFMIWREMFRYILREADLDTVECFDIFFCCM